MTIVVTEKNRALFPPSVRRKARIRIGDELEVSVSGGVITMFAKPPSAQDEYTPAERRAIDAELAKSLEDVKHGRTHTFGAPEEMIAFLHGRSSTKAKKSTKPRVR